MVYGIIIYHHHIPIINQSLSHHLTTVHPSINNYSPFFKPITWYGIIYHCYHCFPSTNNYHCVIPVLTIIHYLTTVITMVSPMVHGPRWTTTTRSRAWPRSVTRAATMRTMPATWILRPWTPMRREPLETWRNLGEKGGLMMFNVICIEFNRIYLTMNQWDFLDI